MKTLTYLLFSLILVLFPFVLSAQSPDQAKTDSLMLELKKDLADSSRVNIILPLSLSLLNSGMFEEARKYLDEGLLLAEKNELEAKRAKLLNMYGITYYYQGQPVEALKYWEEALTIAKKSADEKTISKIQMNLANAENAFGNFPAALKIYLDLIPVFEKQNDQQSIALMLGNIGTVYSQMNDLPKAIDYYDQSQVLTEKLGMAKELIGALINLAVTYGQLKQLDKGKAYYQKGLELAEKNNFLHEIDMIYSGLGSLYMEEGHLIAATEALYRSNAVCAQIGDVHTFASNLGRLASLYLRITEEGHEVEFDQYFDISRQKVLVLAQEKIDSSVMLLEPLENLLSLQYAYQIKSQIEMARGDYKNALNSHGTFKMLSDSILNLERDKKMTQIGMQYEFDKKEAVTKALQDKKDTRQRTIRNSIAGGFLSACLFLGVVYRQRNRIAIEKKRSDELLLNILPAEVAEELKENGSTKAKDFDQVTVLFTDFKNFTNLSETLSAQELVNEINYCYSEFDKIISKHGIEKIKTIGDSYMCAGGLPVANVTNAEETVRAALEIRDFVEVEKQKRISAGKPFFEIRIGCHTGPVVAGIVGLKKFAYDIWGDTVNIASRMETSGEPGKVNISGNTYNLLQDKFTFQHRGEIAAKNKGLIEMYFVENLAN